VVDSTKKNGGKYIDYQRLYSRKYCYI